ncbi:hypothetical protein K0T92_04375 [Paenibacillus oenotherae]|uniref:Import inner membrane translocase subunit Tim44 n=1 Tax=Paenibacillus oenotherae TaxID=1435645 RepID=A0ABS7D292_9BACL|nr:hypothetical protein [Paenibacillus oenotherae]MBW7473968.1 hypothetical protein [Paenibacillus oenotherae]
MKKTLLLLMAFTLFVAFSAGAADARPRGGIKSPKKSFTQTPKKQVNESNSGTKAPGTPAAGTKANRGFFSGGSLMKGLMIGGIAGLLFGGMFANLGFLGDFLGLLINVLAIYVLFIAIRGIFRYFRNNRKPSNPDDWRR